MRMEGVGMRVQAALWQTLKNAVDDQLRLLPYLITRAIRFSPETSRRILPRNCKFLDQIEHRVALAAGRYSRNG